MELDRYQALICAIETGSLSAAAEKLQYTPSGVSRMIATLEQEAGFSLLLRERNGVRPTSECNRILPAIRELLQAGKNCTQLFAQVRGIDIGTVTVGTAYSAYYSWLAKIISDFHVQYPGIQVQIRNGYSAELLEQLNSHHIDLCIISKREGNYKWFPICDDAMMAWLPCTHPLASLPAFPIELFAEEPYIETYPNKDIDNTRVFTRCGINPNLKFTTMDSLATYSMVEAGLGLSMNNAINGRLWAGNVKILPLVPPQTVEIGIAAQSTFSPAAQRFFTFMEPYFAAINKSLGFMAT